LKHNTHNLKYREGEGKLTAGQARRYTAIDGGPRRSDDAPWMFRRGGGVPGRWRGLSVCCRRSRRLVGDRRRGAWVRSRSPTVIHGVTESWKLARKKMSPTHN